VALLLGPLLLGAVLGRGSARAEDDAPALQFSEEEHDFGICEQNKEYAAEITYRNAGTTPIREIRVRTDCGCYAASISHVELAPGETGTIRIRFRTLTFSGTLEKKVRLVYDDGQPRKATLKLKLNIFGGVVLEPGRLHFGEVLRGTRPAEDIAVLWYEGVGRPFEIRSVDVAGEPIATRSEPFTHPKNPRWRGWKIHFQFEKPPARGVYSRRAVVMTTSKDTPRVIVPMTAHVVGKVWVQTHRLHLGLVPQGETRSAELTFRPFDDTIQLGTVTARSRRGVLKATIEQGMGSRGPTTRLRVTAPADAPAGSLDDVVELRTQVPGEEVTEIEVRGRVYKKTGP
jgi:Protein of unknown function (DUF1573)